MKNTLTALLLVFICGIATAQTKITTEQSNDAFTTFMSKKPQVSFLQQKRGPTCERLCFDVFLACIAINPNTQSFCYRQINQCLNHCNT